MDSAKIVLHRWPNVNLGTYHLFGDTMLNLRRTLNDLVDWARGHNTGDTWWVEPSEFRRLRQIAHKNGWSLFPDHIPTGPHYCELCSEILHTEQTRFWLSYEYPWDGSDAEGSISQEIVHVACRNTQSCKRNRQQFSGILCQAARAEDAAMRESGWGVIGGPRHG